MVIGQALTILLNIHLITVAFCAVFYPLIFSFPTDLIVTVLNAVATPKQIRDLMKVDGLTNDEVKSHLQVGTEFDGKHFLPCSPISHLLTRNPNFLFQKYRLRMTSSSNAKNRPAAIGGGGWVHEEQHSASLQQSVPQSGSPESPLRLPVASTTGDSCEEEDRKSESHNCV